jgi:hypothetical protein
MEVRAPGVLGTREVTALGGGGAMEVRAPGILGTTEVHAPGL